MGGPGPGRRRLRTRRKDTSIADALAGFAAGVVFGIAIILCQQFLGQVPAIGSSPPGTLSAQNGTAAAVSTRASSTGTVAAGGGTSTASRARSATRPVNLTAANHFPGAVRAAAVGAADEIDRLLTVGSLQHLFLSYGNSAYFGFAHNWAISVQQIGAPYVIAAFDDAMLDLCDTHSLPCVRAQLVTPQDFRGDFAAFRAMGAVKVRLVLEILERHPQLPLLVVSDSDIVWQRQPWTYFEHRPTADFFVSTDCLSHRMEEEWKPRHEKPLCGHVPGNSGVAFNTGLFAARRRPATLNFLRAWFEMLTDPEKQRHSDPEHRGIDDQLALNLLFDPGVVSAVSADDPRTILVFNSSLKLQALPVAMFPGGHVAFVQRLPQKLGIEPYAIHLTWQRWGRAGKVARLREFGLWHLDPPEYYAATSLNTSGNTTAAAAAATAAAAAALDDDGATYDAGGLGSGQPRFLTYQNDVLAFVERVAQQRYEGGRMPLLYKHWLGASYQLAAFRDALAAARMLGRTVVLPTLWCWCDYDEVPNSGILETCLINAGDYQSPFQCPLDFLLPIEVLDELKIDYRPAGFLDLPQVPDPIRHSRTLINIVPDEPDDPPEYLHTSGHFVTAWTGMTQLSLTDLVLPVASSSVVELRGQVPGLILTFDNPSEAEAFDRMFERIQEEAFWCCFTWGEHDEEYRKLPYAVPQPYSIPDEKWKEWEPPTLEVPDWCDKVSTVDRNNEFTSLPQHPCAFLRNTEAARLAAGGGQAAALRR